MNTGPKPKSLEQICNELLSEATYTDDGCILVTKGYSIGAGYKRRNYNYQDWYVHHIVDFLARGEIPPGIVRRHTCDRPNCINIEHIIRGTQADNIADKIARGRHNFGATHPNVKINAKQVREIRERLKNRRETYAELSKEYGISPGAIHHIGTRKTWSWVK